MVKNFKKAFMALICSIFLFSNLATVMASPATVPTPGSATIMNTDKQAKVMEKLNISENKLIAYLKANSKSGQDIQVVIENFFTKDLSLSEQFTPDEVTFLNNQANENRKAKIRETKNENEPITLRKSLEVNDKIVEFYENGIFSVGPNPNTLSTKSPVSTSETQSAVSSLQAEPTASIAYARISEYGQSYKDYYSWAGKYIFTVAQYLNFWYDGISAGYNGGYDAYYTRASLVTKWSVDSWTKGHNQAGSWYEARCSGNFHTGFTTIVGEFILDDVYVSQLLECDPNGYIYATYTER